MCPRKTAKARRRFTGILPRNEQAEMPARFTHTRKDLKALPLEAALFQVPYIGRHARGLLRLTMAKGQDTLHIALLLCFRRSLSVE